MEIVFGFYSLIKFCKRFHLRYLTEFYIRPWFCTMKLQPIITLKIIDKGVFYGNFFFFLRPLFPSMIVLPIAEFIELFFCEIWIMDIVVFIDGNKPVLESKSKKSCQSSFIRGSTNAQSHQTFWYHSFHTFYSHGCR